MYPILFQIGPFTISSFGVMMVMAFLLGNYLLRKDVMLEGYSPIIADEITFRAAIGGILGAKIYYLIETIPTGQAFENMNGLVEIIAGIFTFSLDRIGVGIQNFGAGLVFLGGFIGGLLAVSLYVYKERLNWLKTADWVAPFLVLGHGIGRIGCFLVGDDYGIPSNLPWACAFPNGLPPTDVLVHPTQIYEMIAYFLIFYYLRYRKRNQKFSGELMFEYLFLAGFSRFMIEFIRTNTRYWLNLSGAQYLSILMMVLGAYFLWKYRIKSSTKLLDTA
jgi:phosphatidylglycerol:prolipoprotein diacylglycerol transferase